ncbi:MAG: endo-1,4-beta-xylanase [Treponema sp.]|nr:endo-1,4-beta-xylanase [Treponema sp.]
MKKSIMIITVVLTCVCFSCCTKKSETAKNTQSPFQSQFPGLSSNKDSAEAQPVEDNFVEDGFIKEARLCDLAQKYGFKVGACISYNLVSRSGYVKMLTDDFNTTTGTNEFKAYSLLDQRKSMAQGVPVMNYYQADAIARLAQAKGIGIRGHVLVWDAYMTEWFFREDFRSDGKIVNKDEMQRRVKLYIEDVITHFETQFPGVVYCWDVVNEAVADEVNERVADNDYHLRKSRGGSPNLFYGTMGEDYVKYAFQCARETVNKVNPDIKLFYNDYNTFYEDKRDAIIRMIQYINKEEKLCDGIGMQGYIGGYGQQEGCMNPNDLNLIKTAIKKYSDLGLEVQLTEVAVRNYDKAQIDKHAEFYGKLFKTIISACNEGANFTGITIWGITDNPSMPKNDYSYKMNGPYCGLFSEFYEPKESYKEVYKVLCE